MSLVVIGARDGGTYRFVHLGRWKTLAVLDHRLEADLGVGRYRVGEDAGEGEGEGEGGRSR